MSDSNVKREPRGNDLPLPTYIPQIEGEDPNFDPQETIAKIMADCKPHSERQLVNTLLRVYSFKAKQDVDRWIKAHMDDLDLKPSGTPKRRGGGTNLLGQIKVYSYWKIKQNKREKGQIYF